MGNFGFVKEIDGGRKGKSFLMSLGLMMMLCMIPTPRLLTGRAHMDLHHDRIARGDLQTKNPRWLHNETRFFRVEVEGGGKFLCSKKTTKKHSTRSRFIISEKKAKFSFQKAPKNMNERESRKLFLLLFVLLFNEPQKISFSSLFSCLFPPKAPRTPSPPDSYNGREYLYFPYNEIFTTLEQLTELSFIASTSSL